MDSQQKTTVPISDIADTEPPVANNGTAQRSSSAVPASSFRYKWYGALKQVLPIYIAVHVAFLITTCLSFLFTVSDFSWRNASLNYLWRAWRHWDTGHYIGIATSGYQKAYQTAFFPLYPLLMSGLNFITHSALVSGLLIANCAGLVMLVVLYQLVAEDFSPQQAWRTVLYISIFPTAFFFAAAYNESLFLSLALLSFYCMRHGKWWLAGLFGFLACLTRSAGLLLLLPFCYEYLRQREFNPKSLRFDALSVALIPAGLAVFAGYCYIRFNDPLAFSHAQAHWQHQLHGPWHGIIGSMTAIYHSSGLLSFQALRNLIDLVPDLLAAIVILLSFAGRWHFPRSHWSYGIYAAALYIFFQLFPVAGTSLFPLQSVSRYLLEIFPAFIVVAGFGASRSFNLYYTMICGAILFFLLTQFLTGHWII